MLGTAETKRRGPMTPANPGGAINMRPPYRLADDTVIVLTGPDEAVRDAVHDKAWRASIGLGHGTRPLFVPRPLFAEYGELLELDTTAVSEARGCVFVNGWSWDYPDLRPLHDLVPSLIMVASGEASVGMAPYLRDLAWTEAPAMHAQGDCGQVGEALYSEMFRLGLLAPRQADGRRR